MMSHANFATFARQYESDKGVKLCGIGKNCKEPPEPVDCVAVYTQLGGCIRQDLDQTAATCQEAYTTFKSCLE